MRLFYCKNQIRKEPEKAPIPKVIIAADKAKEQEKVSRAREEISTKREQIHITHEKVNTAVIDVAHQYTFFH